MREVDSGYYYQMMQRAIDLIDLHPRVIPLESLVARMDMSTAYFQRLFSRWVGDVTKKISTISRAQSREIALG